MQNLKNTSESRTETTNGGKLSRDTQVIRLPLEKELDVKEVLKQVYAALSEKGYNPVNQIVGYIMSGDPTYITSYQNARSTVMKVERDELVEEMLTEYIKTKGWK